MYKLIYINLKYEMYCILIIFKKNVRNCYKHSVVQIYNFKFFLAFQKQVFFTLFFCSSSQRYKLFSQKKLIKYT